jgi:hypothetical protein
MKILHYLLFLVLSCLLGLFLSAFSRTTSSKAQTLDATNQNHLQELKMNRAKWEYRHWLNGYDFRYGVTCRRCPHRGPWTVRVQDDSIINVETKAGRTVPLADAQKFIPTIDELFDKIQKGIESNSAEIRVNYHETFFYPELFYINFRLGSQGGEVSERIDNFVPLGDEWW